MYVVRREVVSEKMDVFVNMCAVRVWVGSGEWHCVST